MTRQVALSEETYARLRSQRRPDESFSEAIDRLIDNQRRSPMAFIHGLRPDISAKAWLAQVEEDREADRMVL